MALAERMLAARFNRPGHEIVDHHTYVDRLRRRHAGGRPVRGRARSPGTSASASSIAFYDDNHITIEGDTDLAFSEDVGKRYEAYGWHVQDLGEDIDLDAHRPRPSSAAKEVTDRPIADHRAHAHRARRRRTSRTRGEAHGAPLGDEEIRLTKEAYGWPSRGAVPRPRRGARALPRAASSAARGPTRSGTSAFDRLPATRSPTLAAELERDRARRAARGLGRRSAAQGARRRGRRDAQGLQRGRSSGSPRACPSSSAARPTSAPSTCTLIDGAGSVSARGTTPGATCTSASASTAWARSSTASRCRGFRGYGATFLIFCDYMKAVDPPRRAHAACRRSSSSRTTRSASARTARPTSRSSSSRTLRATPGPPRRPPGRLQRDRAGLALRDQPHRRARRRSRSRARACRSSTRTRSPATPSSAAPTSCATPTAASRT